MTIYGREGSSPSAPNFELKISLDKFMCICINCEFYNLCWIKKGLNKIPKVYTNSTLKINLNRTKFSSSQLSTSLFLKVFLNVFTKKYEYEFDVVECEGFCEQPGIWLNNINNQNKI